MKKFYIFLILIIFSCSSVDESEEIDDLVPELQATTEISYAKKIDKKEAKIDWSLSFKKIELQIRGLSQFPGAWAFYNGERIKFLNVRTNSSKGIDKVAPGTVIGEPLVIACEGGALEIVSLQRPGKSVQTAEDFLRGFPIQIGSTFE